MFEKNPKDYLLSMENRLPGHVLDIMDSCGWRKVKLSAVRVAISPTTLIQM